LQHSGKGRKLEILLAAGIIEKFNKGTSLEEIYKRGIRCYGVLLDLLENPEIAKEISEFTKLPLGRIENCLKNSQSFSLQQGE
jgi:hypothetical protein